MFDILEDDRFIKMASSLGQNKSHTSTHTRYSFSVSFLSLSTFRKVGERSFKDFAKTFHCSSVGTLPWFAFPLKTKTIAFLLHTTFFLGSEPHSSTCHNHILLASSALSRAPYPGLQNHCKQKPALNI